MTYGTQNKQEKAYCILKLAAAQLLLTGDIEHVIG